MNAIEWLERNAPAPWRDRDTDPTPDEAYREILREARLASPEAAR